MNSCEAEELEAASLSELESYNLLLLHHAMKKEKMMRISVLLQGLYIRLTNL